MVLEMRPFTWQDDFERVRAFLIHVHALTQSLQNWLPSQFENLKFGPCGPEYQDEDDAYVRLWHKVDDPDSPSAAEIVAITISKPSGDCWMQVHPDHRADERQLVHWMEKQSREMHRGEDRELRFYVDETDEQRKALLAELGYEDTGFQEYNRIRSVDQPIPEYQPPNGFTVRSADVVRDFVQYSKVQATVFPHCSMTERTVRIYSTASFYHKDLDLVAVDPQGTFAAFCTVRIDPVSRLAELEPVGTHPDYRKLGLARAVICEGLHRLQKYEPSLICIPGAAATEAANRLYDSVGFTKKTEVHAWRKRL